MVWWLGVFTGVVCFVVEAEKLIRERLAESETATLLCYLGDVTADVQHYHRAWQVSGQRSARSQRSLAYFYFNRAQVHNVAAISNLVTYFQLNVVSCLDIQSCQLLISTCCCLWVVCCDELYHIVVCGLCVVLASWIFAVFWQVPAAQSSSSNSCWLRCSLCVGDFSNIINIFRCQRYGWPLYALFWKTTLWICGHHQKN